MDFLKIVTNKIRDDPNKSDDEFHDQIGSISVTPSGIATPRPDPSDKRLPGILHGYFGQVGHMFSTTPSMSGSCSVVNTNSRLNEKAAPLEEPMQSRPRQASKNAPLTAPHSPERPTNGDELGGVYPSLGKQIGSIDLLVPSMRHLNVSSYPTPPNSSSSSLKQKENEEKTLSTSDPSKDFQSETQSMSRAQSAVDILSSKPARHAKIKSLSGIITPFSVQAAHLSNPTSRSPTQPSTPIHEVPLSALTSLTSSYLELTKLTDGGPKKATPPRTPRALSNDNVTPSQDALAPATVRPQSPLTRSPRGLEPQSSTKTNNSRDLEELNGTVQTKKPRGTLSVTINEARGIRPSHDPYVVCVFESNEYISKGPQNAPRPSAERANSSAQLDGGGVPIKRSASDMGKAMAIPMKSRQSSTASLSDQKNFQKVHLITVPEWNQKVIL